MFPPGRVLFVRPLKTLVRAERRGEERRMKHSWDVVWITSQELLAEGILVSKKVLTQNLMSQIDSNLRCMSKQAYAVCKKVLLCWSVKYKGHTRCKYIIKRGCT